MMTKTKFPECKRYLHQAGNNALNSLDKFTEVRVLFNAINARCILNDHPTQHVSVNESMVPCFGNKLWVMAIPLGYRIQFRIYADNDSILPEYENIGVGLCASVVADLVRKLPVMQTSNYHIVMENYFTIPALLRHLSRMGVAATGTVRPNRMESSPLRDMVKMNKGKHGSLKVVTDVFSNITAVCSKDNKLNGISTFTGKQPIQQVKRYSHREK